ncbi:MAG: DUF4239 domain-containing protein [Gammaproteobacteria bacterium]|nr:DUF4239 domain-containing protein [Gammaproteobacteria bacterium]
MYNLWIALALFVSLVGLLSVGVIAGRYFGRWLMKHEDKEDVEVVSVAEGALFALLGLLVAFTFTGAYERFELRAKAVSDESSVMYTAYLRLDLLVPSEQPALRQRFRDYVDSRLATYAHLPSLKSVYDAWHHSEELQTEMWNQALVACRITHDASTTQLLLPALNAMFEIASSRIDMVKNHPPAAIFILLIGLAFVSAFLAGYTTSKNKKNNSIHIITYVAITAVILYVIIDMEFPRFGLITVTSYDKILIDFRKSIN